MRGPQTGRVATALFVAWLTCLFFVGCDSGAPEGAGLDAAVTGDARVDPVDEGLTDGPRPDAARDASVDAMPDAAADANVDARVGCTTDEDCPANAWCDGNACRTGCRFGDADACPTGQICTDDHQCVEGCADGAACATGLPGRCGAGTLVCAADGSARCEASTPAAAAEACDGIDDDCDGRVDETYPTLGAVCQAGLGRCAAPGNLRCSPDGAGVACVSDELRAPVAETCDGIDDDCDGQTDEDFAGLGSACDAGIGACAAAGLLTCTADGAGTRCSAQARAPGVETCNGIDDDCDGQVDEGDAGEVLVEPCFDGPANTRGVGACVAGQRTCVDGAFGACVGQVLPRAEVCNGVDDDCNRLVDDERGGALTVACYAGPAGTEGVGPCHAGTRLCVGGALGPCEGAVTPSEDFCDLEDNDCDGDADDVEGGCDCVVGEQRPCYSGPQATEGRGVCHGGTQVCVDPGRWGSCAGQVLPSAELCNRLDDDCNGINDDAVEGTNEPCVNGQGICTSQGTTACAILGGFRCSAPAVGVETERCNGLDDDCDGAADEVFPVGEACASGLGACARAGQTACTALGALVCNAQAGQPSVETCNLIDDDCDGLVDEDFATGGLCPVGVGACQRVGTIVCNGPASTTCDAVAGAPSVEACNGLDDDCDGGTDEGYNRGGPCEVGLGVCRAAGILRCTPDGGSTCSALPGPSRDEVCNGVDDDCDGNTDENLAATDPCITSLVGECRPGLLACLDGSRRCVPRNEPARERCDGRDDDCNGEIDDAGTVSCGLGICRRDIQACAGGRNAVCDPFVGRQDQELCNGLDDDCDGTVDELALGDGGPCGNGIGGCRGAGIATCANGALQCNGVPTAPEPETCDGVDEDCDGRTDENTVAPVACVSGVGACARPGNTACIGGAPGCDGVPVAPAAVEACNGLDDDCDGLTDEDLGFELCGVGICRRVLANCEGGADPGACDPLLGAQAEVCNGLDDDCDGVTDEGVPGTGVACVGGQGICRGPSATACIAGRLQCPGPIAPQAERCNGLDDNCDGVIDDAPVDAGGLCTGGVGGCARPGALRCTNATLRCDAVPGAPGVDVCNGTDDDCDGNTDERLGTVVCGQGRCLRDLPACEAGGPPFCVPEQGSIDEQCNAVDDDCDGTVDEDSPQVGSVCLVGIGVCATFGQRQCEGGALVCEVVGQAAPQAELCNALDDDCDGTSDEDFGVGRLCETGVGQCRTLGRVICVEGGAAVCQANLPAAQAETCNALDDDCDGRVDEGLDGVVACVSDLPGICAAGRLRCNQGQASCERQVNPVNEVCNGLDDDCDGRADETLAPVACGVGACARNVAACVNGAPAQCDPMQGAQPESCNGRDDDCDGRVDEQALELGQACTSGLGACGVVGTFACENGAPRCTAVARAPQLERCNRLDDDCDGRTDEDALETGEQCFAGAGVCRQAAFQTCFDGEVRCPAVAGPPGGAEVCDSVDNDCDGTTDEGFGAVECGVGICRRQLAACNGGQQPQCNPLQGARAETCNGLDDDCDGITDEAVAGQGQPCGVGLGECRRDGVTQCTAGATRCSVVPGNPAAELCNGRDDDCDGITDEAAQGVGQVCSAGAGTCQRAGNQQCVLGQLRCDAVAGAPGNEICNAQDDDCDTRVDEGLGQQICGLGICQRAVFNCLVGQPGQCDPIAGAEPEMCNGADDDCDGEIDESLGVIECGVGVCFKQVPSCSGGFQANCDPTIGRGPEVCDGLDNDCDGRIDEQALGHNQPCADGVGACEAIGTQRCIAGSLICDAAPLPPGLEFCDLIDNDCDGTTDEELVNIDEQCERGLNECRRVSRTTCVDGFVVCPAVEGPPSPEVCDQLDNDCDNAFDEGGTDCDFNGFNDQCDLQFGRHFDCNGNGIPDKCDIAAGRSADCNRNRIPDECNNDGSDCTRDDIPPDVQVTTISPVVVEGGTLEARVVATDNLGVVQIGMLLNGVAQVLDGAGVAQVRLPVAGRYTLEGFALDARGNRGSQIIEVRALLPASAEAPRPSRDAASYGACVPANTCPVVRAAPRYIQAAPGDVIALDGSGSSNANRWQWQVVSATSPITVVEAFPGNPDLGGPADDPSTPMASVRVPAVGRYRLQMVVENDTQVSPSVQCPSGGGVLIEASAAVPVRANGEACDRLGRTDRCVNGLVCRPTPVGVNGVCGRRFVGLSEREPDNGPDDVTTIFLGADTQGVGRLDPCQGDVRDLWATVLERAGTFTVEVLDYDGLCAGNPRLTRIDNGRFESLGLAAAMDAPLNRNDNANGSLCSRIVFDANPGLQVFVVDTTNLSFKFDYAIRIRAIQNRGERCDVGGVEAECQPNLFCSDPNNDGDGNCQP